MGSLLSKTKPPKAPTDQSTKMSTPAAFTHYAGAQTEFKLPLIANENAFLGDLATSNDPVAPIVSGFYRLEKGTPLVYDYTYHEMKVIVDGEFDISDETGQKVHAVKGDVFYCELRIGPVGIRTDVLMRRSPQGKQDYLHDREFWTGIFCWPEEGM
jgi:uncharacterized cupin superfamily protein